MANQIIQLDEIPTIKSSLSDSYYDPRLNTIELGKGIFQSFPLPVLDLVVNAYACVSVDKHLSLQDLQKMFDACNAQSGKGSLSCNQLFVIIPGLIVPITKEFFDFLSKEKADIEILSSSLYDIQRKFLNELLVDLYNSVKGNQTEKNFEAEERRSIRVHELSHYVCENVLFGDAVRVSKRLKTATKNIAGRNGNLAQTEVMQLSKIFSWLDTCCEAYSIMHELACDLVITESSKPKHRLFQIRMFGLLFYSKAENPIDYGSFFCFNSISQIDDHQLAFLLILTNGEFLELSSTEISSRTDNQSEEVDRYIFLKIKAYKDNPDIFLQSIDLYKLKQIIEIKIWDCLTQIAEILEKLKASFSSLGVVLPSSGLNLDQKMLQSLSKNLEAYSLAINAARNRLATSPAPQ